MILNFPHCYYILLYKKTYYRLNQPYKLTHQEVQALNQKFQILSFSIFLTFILKACILVVMRRKRQDYIICINISDIFVSKINIPSSVLFNCPITLPCFDNTQLCPALSKLSQNPVQFETNIGIEYFFAITV